MASPSPYQAALATGNQLAESFTQRRDENAIESILSKAMQSGDPKVVQNSIGKILSQVSPERQGLAVNYLQSVFQNLEQKQQTKQKTDLEKEAAQQAGYTYGAPSTVQAQQVKDTAKANRLRQYGIDLPQQQIIADTPLKSVFSKLTDDQLISATGAPDKEVSEPAKAELKRRDEERKIDQKIKSDVFRGDLGRAQKIIEKSDEIAAQIPQKRSSLNLMKDAVATGNLSYFSPDNIAEITGIEGLRSPEGALFKTAGKEYFLGNISRAGARPNQWIEQQISDMLPTIGRSIEANLTVLRALENELDLDETRVKLTNQISDSLREKGDYSQSKLSSMLNKELSQYAEKRQDVLFNDLRAIKAIAEKKPQKFRKVEKGTPVSDYIAQALLLQFNNDPKKAADEAKKLGYEF